MRRALLLLALLLSVPAATSCYKTVMRGDHACREYTPSCPPRTRETCRTDEWGCRSCTCECDGYDCGLDQR